VDTSFLARLFVRARIRVLFNRILTFDDRLFWE
jgi:hypothetical protein